MNTFSEFESNDLIVFGNFLIVFNHSLSLITEDLLTKDIFWNVGDGVCTTGFLLGILVGAALGMQV